MFGASASRGIKKLARFFSGVAVLRMTLRFFAEIMFQSFSFRAYFSQVIVEVVIGFVRDLFDDTSPF
jgi:hypothetical protein